jgi:hypothetical protein
LVLIAFLVWSKHFPEERIYKGFPTEVVEKIISEQEDKYKRILDGEKLMPFICIVLDDIISDGSVKHNDLWNYLVFSGRHIFAFVILCSQDVKGTSIIFVSSVQYPIIFRN